MYLVDPIEPFEIIIAVEPEIICLKGLLTQAEQPARDRHATHAK